MSVVSIREEYLKEIADAIREKTGTEMPVTTDTMAAAIMSLETTESSADLTNYYTKLETELILDLYATKEYVDDAVANGGGTGDGSSVDLSEYATIAYVDEQIAALGGSTGDDSGETTEDVVLYDWADEAGITPVDGTITLTDWAPIGDEYKGIELTVEATIRATVVESGETVEDNGVWEATVDPETNILIVNGAEALFNPAEINNETGAAAAGDIFNDGSLTDAVVIRMFIRTGTPSSNDGSSELTPDGATIVVDENGVISTVIGGSYGEATEEETLVEATGSFVAADNTISLGITIDQTWWEGEVLYAMEYEYEGSGTQIWNEPGACWIGPYEEGDGVVTQYMLGNIQNANVNGAEWGADVLISPDGVITSDVISEGLTITRFWLYRPGSPAINYINNEFIDTGYVATVDYVNSMIEELRARLDALEDIGNAEEGAY